MERPEPHGRHHLVQRHVFRIGAVVWLFLFKKRRENQKVALPLSLSLSLSNVKRLVREVYVCEARVEASTVAHVGL